MANLNEMISAVERVQPAHLWIAGGLLFFLSLAFMATAAVWAIIQIKPFPDFALPKHLTTALGKPLIDAEQVSGNYQAQYEKASVIWIGKTLNFYVLPTRVENRQWLEYSEPAAPDKALYDEEYLKELFPDTPSGKLPPYAGLAREWLINPEIWKTLIGWRVWHCGITKTYVQEFENGKVVGPLVAAKKDDRALILILFKDKTWALHNPKSLAAPKCEEVLKP